MTTSGITGSSTTDALTSAATSGATQANNRNNLASEETFLKLFVAQLQNQDPLSPNQQDPTQMVSELAQFSQLEQMVNIGSDVHSISQDIAGTVSAANTNSQNQANGTTGAVGSA
ncbi:MAG TPA: flagellar hook capping FlgD N-terminal domain-containing protein [Bryobacteraceae bacterium]|nr:flagellar hook capping FlgD N-terminal domain-containing protein [Bryobacteraceae bacterium]